MEKKGKREKGGLRSKRDGFRLQASGTPSLTPTMDPIAGGGAPHGCGNRNSGKAEKSGTSTNVGIVAPTIFPISGMNPCDSADI